MTAFDALRLPNRPTDPDPRFVDRLHTELAAALAPLVDLPERSTTVNATAAPAPAPAPTATDPAADGSSADSPVEITLVPYLSVRGASEAIAWYVDVFDGREVVRYTADDGRIGHAEIAIGAVTFYLSDEYPDFDAVSPSTLGGSSVALNLVVPDVDAVFARAVAGGATVRREPENQAYGERSCTFLDPWGHRWMVQTRIATPTTAEIDAAMDGFTVTEPDTEPGIEPGQEGPDQ